MKELIADHGEAILYVITGILIAGCFTMFLNVIT